MSFKYWLEGLPPFNSVDSDDDLYFKIILQESVDQKMKCCNKRNLTRDMNKTKVMCSQKQKNLTKTANVCTCMYDQILEFVKRIYLFKGKDNSQRHTDV